MLIEWVWTLAFLAVAGHCVARLSVVRDGGAARTHWVADAVMAAGMAAMVSPVGGPIPLAGWETAFVVALGWSLVAACRSEPLLWLRQAVAAAAMLYMLVTTGTHHGQVMSGPPVVSVLLAAYFLAVAGWSMLPVVGLRAAVAGGATGVLGPRVVSGCEVVMAAGMAVMLLH
ncbi:DUF5134 domain-containing protein [Fodinicola acaciae]|uniref:DUF5134 domain-containing protein n=1 Tax=Fodinicola acaciae TaxID=2681555 RepID=UPI0013D7D185|nr:DUF5134 domain-containing protein [Fodinicola acaciae]